MPTELKMPALSPTMEEGTLAKWLVKEGDDVKSGDILAEIETDKATMEFEAVDEGKIAKILVPEGTDGVKVGQPIALLAGDGEQVSDAAPAAAHRCGSPKPDRRKTRQGVEIPASQQDEATPTPHVFETAARDLVADVAKTHDEPEVPEGTPLVTHDRARGAARRDGRGNARRRARVRDGRGGRRISGRLQGHAEPARRSSGPSASSTRRSPNMALPGSAPARRWAGCVRSSSS